ncbi:MAG: hypothetical protein M1838_004079 [Thelocarpon superellum]|nr:MAG: hypothetical protein M1838_004079 [Thelocarpon superellum]
MTQMHYVPHGNIGGRPEKSGYDAADAYNHAPTFAAACSLMYPSQPVQQPTYNGFPPPGITHPPQTYGSIGAPILPPLRIHGQPLHDGSVSSHHAHSRAPTANADTAKDDKAIGGVAAFLDYEMEHMSDYVAEMAQGMYELYDSKLYLPDVDMIRSVQPSVAVSPAFRKFVVQILSSTRLPSSTILLGLYYLNIRMNMLSAHGRHETSSGQVYRMLTIALLLGSKFLDDNTFQNRSWSEVTSLPVSELNTLEVEWLVAIDWNLHIDPNERHGFMTWREHWQHWRGKAAEQPVMKLLPLDSNIQRSRQPVKHYSPTPMYPPQHSKSVAPPMSDRAPMAYQPPVPYDPSAWAYSRPVTERSPPSASGTGPTTPEYYGGWSAHAHAPPPYSARPHSHYSSQPPSYHQTPYMPPYNPNVWHGHPHGAGCGCAHCVRPNEHYFIGSGYGQQTVMG